MNTISKITTIAAVAFLFTACKKDETPILVPPPSEGSTLTLKGLVGAESGASAGNSVYVDLSSDVQTPVKRDSWVLAFDASADFNVHLNSTNGASAIVLPGKIDLNTVTAADFDPNKLEIALGVSLTDDPNAFNNIDNVHGDISKNVISTISAIESENLVYIVNPIGGSHSSVISVDEMYKIRVLRKGNGYILQYAKVKDATFKSVDIAKDNKFNSIFINFSAGTAVPVAIEPRKSAWDFVWTWSVYYGGTLGTTNIYPYGFSDLVFTNYKTNTATAEVSSNSISYTDFSEANLPSVNFNQSWDIIGASWRNTTGAAVGVKKNVFYLIKDQTGNIYKLKFVSFHSNDGGVRGMPVLEYKLVKKG